MNPAHVAPKGKVLLAGYYGMSNSGDDALLAVTAWGARHYLGAKRILATATRIPEIPDRKSVEPVLPPAPRVRGENLLRTCWAAFRCRRIVFGGGSVFHTADYLTRAITWLRLAGRGPHAALGVAVGPFTNAKAERLTADLLKRLAFVGVRDQRSYEAVRSLAPDTACQRAFDLALLLPRIDPTLTSAALPARRGLGIALCDYERFINLDPRPEAQRRQRIKALFDRLDPAQAEPLVFIDFNGHPQRGDAPLHREMIDYAAARFQTEYLPYDPNPLRVFRRIGQLRALVAMRLHAAVFGYMAATPMILLSYHAKCDDFAAEAGYSPKLVFDSARFDPAQAAEMLQAAMCGMAPPPTLPPEEAQQLAERNWAWCVKD